MRLRPGELHDWLATNDPLCITPLDDPVVDALGYPARSAYAETYWLPVLGPSAMWTLRRLATWLDAEPGGTSVSIGSLAQELGLGAGSQRNSPMVRTLGRLIVFGMAEVRGDTLAVRRTLPPLARRHALRLPDHLAASHAVELQRAPRRSNASREDGMAAAVPFPA